MEDLEGLDFNVNITTNANTSDEQALNGSSWDSEWKSDSNTEETKGKTKLDE